LRLSVSVLLAGHEEDPMVMKAQITTFGVGGKESAGIAVGR